MRIGGRLRSPPIGTTARRPRMGERPVLPRNHRPTGAGPARRFDPAVQAVLLGVTAGVAAPVVTTPAQTLLEPGPADVAGFEAIAREILFSPAGHEAPPERFAASPDPALPALPGAPAVPAEASELFRAVLLETLPLLRHGTVPAELYVASNNLAAETVAIDPQAIFERMGALIENAEHDIAYQTYNWDIDSDPVRAIFDALERLGQKRAITHPHGPPVAVRLLIDAMPLGANGNAPVERLMTDVEKEAAKRGLDPTLVRLEVAAHRHTLLGSLHSKTLVVDGLTAVVTGANASKSHNFGDGEHDAAFTLVGQVARALLADFDDAWLDSEVWRCGPRIHSTSPSDAACLEPPLSIAHWVRPIPDLPAQARVPMVVLGKQAVESPLTSNEIDNPLAQALLSAFRHAERVIRIQTPNLNDDAVLAAIRGAVASGVRVELILSKGFEEAKESAPGQGGGNQEVVDGLYRWLKDAGLGAGLDRLEIRWYSHDGDAPVEGNAPHASHVKLISVDDQITFLLSKNMDTQSWNHSREVGVMVDSRVLTKKWIAALFAPDWARSPRAQPSAPSAPASETSASGTRR